jgi:hypothetical protein
MRRDVDVLAVIALGGGIGSVARYGLARAWPTPPGGFPWATFVTNVVGCAVLGTLMYLVLEVWPPSRYRRPFLGVGVCGGVHHLLDRHGGKPGSARRRPRGDDRGVPAGQCGRRLLAV